MDELAVELGHGPDGAAPQELDQARGVPVHHGVRADLRQRQLRGGHRQGARADRLGRAAGRAEAAPRPQATRCSSASASRPSPRCAAWRRRGCSARWPTAPAAGSHASIRMLATGKVEVVTGVERRTGRGTRRRSRQIVADQLGVAVGGHRAHPRRHPVLAEGPGHLRLALARRRRHRDRQGRREGDRRRPSTIAAHLLEASEDDLEFNARHVLGQGLPRLVGIAIGEIAFATFAAHNLPDGVEPTPRRRRDLRPGELLLPARHAPVRGRRRHRDRPGQDPQVRLRRRRRRRRSTR